MTPFSFSTKIEPRGIFQPPSLVLLQFNGISMMSIENWSAPDEMLSCDACLLGMGAISKNQFFHTVFPEFLRGKNLHINCLELLVADIK
jgi:hypothetical protein